MVINIPVELEISQAILMLGLKQTCAMVASWEYKITIISHQSTILIDRLEVC